MGFEAFHASDEQCRTVRAMAGFGVPQEDIATFQRVDPKTLRKYFRDELDQGVTEANAKVAQSLFNMATKQNNVAAAIFWMKARAGWREKHEVQVEIDEFSQMSDEELAAERRRLEMALQEARKHAAEERAREIVQGDAPPTTRGAAQALAIRDGVE